MQFSIQEYASSDQNGVKKIVLKGLLEFGFSYHKDLDYDLDDPERFYIKNGGTFYVLKDNRGEIVGTVAIINKGNHIAQLKRLYVTKKYQGQRLGSALFDKAITFCKEKEITKIELETNKKFTTAHFLYKKRGFQTIKENENSYYMEKTI